MSDIPRWAYQYGGMTPFHPSPGGGWVTYADHVAALLTQDQQHMEQQAAAVAAAEQRVRDELPPNGADALWYLLGQRKGVQAARDAAAPFCKCGHAEGEHVGCTLAAIDALVKEKP